MSLALNIFTGSRRIFLPFAINEAKIILSNNKDFISDTVCYNKHWRLTSLQPIIDTIEEIKKKANISKPIQLKGNDSVFGTIGVSKSKIFIDKDSLTDLPLNALEFPLAHEDRLDFSHPSLKSRIENIKALQEVEKNKSLI
ncbi:MAG: hypothetical protein A3F40_02405 [Chlamydiae bacterium RIFCSPHIGHO2_12_FULL_27_8]|nr:MAG: hypothetical protein A3F40_02405 [Chlamydiae bacterium RIFCSPHIGHO2_12_FULL_27_8]